MDKDELAKEFTDECTKKCTEAFIIIKDVVERLEQGKITVRELDTLTIYKKKAVKLLPVVSPNLDADKLIDQRNSEILKFEEYRFAVELLLQYCDKIAEGTWMALTYLCLHTLCKILLNLQDYLLFRHYKVITCFRSKACRSCSITK